jgi:hypothetical protein
LRLLIVGNPGCPRVAGFQAALAARGLPPAVVVHHADLLRGRARLEEYVSPAMCVRIESPGRDFEVEKLLLQAGADAAREEGSPALPCDAVERLTLDPGLILYPRQWYLGFRAHLVNIRQQLGEVPPPRLLNDPDEVALLFDKPACQERLADAGVPVPRSLGRMRSYEALQEAVRGSGLERVFVKLAHGSSASGVVAWDVRRWPGMAVTTAELVRDGDAIRLYNSRRLRTYMREADLADLFGQLCPEGVQVEEWLPKGALSGGRFDLRVVVIAGRARHTVVRTSRTPFTNLHLGNARADLAALLARMEETDWQAARRTCERAAGVVPRSFHVGVDLLVGPDLRSHAVLEMNAFGDLLHGVLDEGMDTYTAEVAALQRSP